MHAIIVGSGIGGLAAALCCLREGIQVTLLEKAEALKEIGAGIQISSNGSKVLRELGLLDKIAEKAVQPLSFRIMSLDSDEIIADMPLGEQAADRYDGPFFQIHRGDLLEALASILPSGVLHFDTPVESFRQDADSVTVRLTNGETVRGDVLIGADGIRSVVRDQLSGQPDTEFSGRLAWRALVPADRLGNCNFEERFYGWAGGERNVFSYWVRPKKLFNFGGIVPSREVKRESWNQSGDVAELRHSFAGANPRLSALINAVDTAFITGLFYKKPLKFWTHGRVTLLGDSAHAMLPYLAQGACQAIEDAQVIAKCLARHGGRNIPDALAEYELKRRPRTTKVQSAVLATSIFWHESDPVLVAARNGRMRGLAQIDPLATTVWRWLYSYNAKEDGESPYIKADRWGKIAEFPGDTEEQRRAWTMWNGMFTPEDEARGINGLREGYDRFFCQFKPTPAAEITEVKAGLAPALWVVPKQTKGNRTILHFHGGGFAFGSAKCSVEYGERLAKAVDGRCLALEYRLAPENPFPAALEDALSAYHWLLENGVSSSDILLSGESAGAGLAFAVALALRDSNERLPAGIIALSPIADFTLTSPSIDKFEGQDPVVDRDILTYMATNYFQSHSPSEPLVSPLFGDFKGLPPMLIQAGRSEVLIDEAQRLAAKAKAAGVNVTLGIYEERMHIFSLFPFLPSAVKALEQVGEFAKMLVR